MNGFDRKSVFELYSITGDTDRVYPRIPNKPYAHRLLRLNDFVYCIGGINQESINTNKVYRLNFIEANTQWKEIASKKISRSNFGAAVFRGGLVVNGLINTTEFYNPRINEWKTIAPTIKRRTHNALVATDDAWLRLAELAEQLMHRWND